MTLEVTDLVVRIDGRPVVDGISFEVPDGSRPVSYTHLTLPTKA